MQDTTTANSEDEKSNEVKTPQQYSFQIAVVLSAIIIGFSVLIWNGVLHIPASPYEAQNSSINIGFNIADFGTYVSGIFTSLSFIWLIVNALQQREDLKLQREEMQENNQHQKDQAKQLENTAKANSDNLAMQREIYANEQIFLYVKTISYFMLFQGHKILVKIKSDHLGIAEKYINRVNLTGSGISLFPSHYSIPPNLKDADEESKIMDRYLTVIMHFFERCHIVEKCLNDNNESISHIENIEQLNMLRAQFDGLEEFLNWIGPSRRKAAHELYRLAEIKDKFKMLELG